MDTRVGKILQGKKNIYALDATSLSFGENRINGAVAQRILQRSCLCSRTLVKIRMTYLTFHVRGHFSHKASKISCNKETQLHATAKALLIKKPNRNFIFRCSKCSTEKVVEFRHWSPTNSFRVQEFYVPDIKRVLDVAILNKNDKEALMGAIEVCHTHACDDEKLLDLEAHLKGLWLEVFAKDVIEAYLRDVCIPIATCSAGMCDVCNNSFNKRLEEQKSRLLIAREKTNEMKKIGDELEEEIKQQALCALENKRRKFIIDSTHINGTRLEFGKYKGTVLEVLIKEDPRYCLWLSSNPKDLEYCIPKNVVSKAKALTRGFCQG